jgi:hypothetical protein
MADLAGFGLEAAYIVPTPTGLKKSIMDAHEGLRHYLAVNGVHDYRSQGQGPDNKKVLGASILTSKGWNRGSASLYRPETKSGDPRIWFSGLGKHAEAWNLLVVMARGDELYLINASDERLWNSIRDSGSPLNELVADVAFDAQETERELLALLTKICARGFIPSTTNADSGVGDTLEGLLGIKRNANKAPDFKGIELKSSRLHGKAGTQRNRSSLFSQAPDWSRSRLKNGREIIDKYGYFSADTGLKALHVTLGKTPNPQGLYLALNEKEYTVENLHTSEPPDEKVTTWDLNTLEDRLAEKHRATFWVKAATQLVGNHEHFHYLRAQITSRPLTANFGPLVASGKIQVDYTFSEKIKPSGDFWVRDHGYLWKVKPADMNLLFPPPRIVDLAGAK